MKYRLFQDLKLSTLGMGCMRLPTVGERGPIDEEKAEAMLEHALANGVNYFDTAYRYHNGASETLVGRVLNRHPRDSWHLATKFPGHMMQYRDGRIQGEGYLTNARIDSPAQIFEEQLGKCGVDFFDLYLLHNVCETSWDLYTNKELGVVKYLLAQKKAGRIRHLGFSAHGRAETIDAFLEWSERTFGEPVFELVQIQLNWLDWTLQDAARKVAVIEKHGLPIVAMEPVRGGRLAKLSPESEAKLKAARPDESVAAWAFRFLQTIPSLQIALSGMTTMEQLQENLSLFSEPKPLVETEQALLAGIAASMTDSVPCTACRYCVEDCPQSLDIPKLISLYNEFRFENPFTIRFTMDAMKASEMPSACVACGACEKVCPQGIEVSKVMTKFAEGLATRM